MNELATYWQAEFEVDPDIVHPWYGPCDALLADGGCAECSSVRFEPGYAETARKWWDHIITKG